jgi:uncharacterized protein (DUF433 family)
VRKLASYHGFDGFMLEFKKLRAMATVITDRITKTAGICGGKACIAGHRVRVMDIVVRHEYLGLSPDELVAAYPELSLSDVHAALAYYFDNVDEIRNDIRRNDEIAGELRASFPSKLKMKLLDGAD